MDDMASLEAFWSNIPLQQHEAWCRTIQVRPLAHALSAVDYKHHKSFEPFPLDRFKNSYCVTHSSAVVFEQDMIVDGTPIWEVFRTIPIYADVKVKEGLKLCWCIPVSHPCMHAYMQGTEMMTAVDES